MEDFSFAVDTAVPLPMGVEAEIRQARESGAGRNYDIATVAAIAPIGATEGHMGFAPEAAAAIATSTADYFDSNAIYEHGNRRAGLKLFPSGNDINALAAFLEKTKLDNAVRQSEEGVIIAQATILACGELGTTLPYNDIACDDLLATVVFHAKAFGFAIAAVTGTTTCFFVCHEKSLPYALIARMVISLNC